MSSSTPSSPHWLGRARRPEGPERVTDFSRLMIGITVVAFGLVFLLDSAGVLDSSETIDRWWPVLLVAAGALTLAERPPSVVRGWLFVGVGAVLLLFTTDVLDDDAWSYVWPAAVILVGLAIIARRQGRPTIADTGAEDDVVRATGIFGGPDIASTSRDFRGAWLTAIFGGVTLDLRSARPAPGGAAINATVVFGGIDVLVPRGWRISVRSTPIFGGVEDKTDHAEPPADDAPLLHVDAVSLFGGVDIKHEK
jgi:hypothetical protein